jgi:dihydroorotase
LKILIKNGRVVDPESGTDETLDILINAGKIVDIKARIDVKNTTLIDASRLVVAPGFIDMHVHLREPGQSHKETIESGARAAAKGGFTSICAMPNTKPVNDNRDVTEYILDQAARKASVNIYPIGAITKGLLGSEPTDMADQMAAGVIAFSDDGRCVQDSRVMWRALEGAKALNALVIDHCEDRSLWEGGVMHDGAAARRFGLPGIPAAAEDIMVARDIILAESLGAHVHIAHLSTKGAVQLVREAKKRNVPITAEATPHHLILNDGLLEKHGTDYKVNPPLRSPEDVRALISAVKDGTVDVFATDHAPHTAKEKDVAFEKAPFGMVGLETAVSLLLDKMVNKNVISLARFIEMISSKPARILGLKTKGRIAVGADADLTVLNLHKTIVVDVAAFQSRSKNSPFDGWKLKGAPVITIVAGKIVYPFAAR